jgi:hypothetical protein
MGEQECGHVRDAHLGRPRPRRRLARLHPDVLLRRQRAGHRRPRRGSGGGRRRRQAVPRRHLVAVGHDARPPGARARRRAGRPAGPGRPHDHARQRQPRRDRAVGGAGRGGAGRRTARPLRVGRRRRGGAGAEGRLPVLGEPRRGRTYHLRRPRRRVPRRHRRLAVGRRRRLRHRPVRPAALPGRPGPHGRGRGHDRGRAGRRAGRRRRRAAGAGRGGHDPPLPRCVAPAGRGVPGGGRAARRRRGRHRLRPHRHVVRLGAVRAPSRRPRPRQGDHRGLPADVGDRGQRRRVRRLPRARPVRAHALPRALLRRERAGRGGGAAPPPAPRGVGRAGQRPGPLRAAAGAAGRAGGPAAGREGDPAAGADGRRRAGTPGRRSALGPAGVRRRDRAGRAAAPAGRRGRAHADADLDRRGDRADRGRAGGIGHGGVCGPERSEGMPGARAREPHGDGVRGRSPRGKR